MSKSFSTLIPDIQSLFDGAILKDISGFADQLSKEVGRRFEEHLAEKEPTLRMSNLGKPLRQLWYDLKGYKIAPLSATVKLKFLYGALIEEMILFLAKEAGHEVRDEQKEIEVDGVKGHIDGTIDSVLVDIKSCSPRSFDKFRYASLFTDDPFGYIGQLSGYSKGGGYKQAAFIAIDKVSGELCSLELPYERITEYDVSSRIRTVREAISRLDEPERCYSDRTISKTDKSGNRILSVGCSYCGHRAYCWRDSNGGSGLQVRQYASGPKYFTHIEKEPRLKNNNTFEQFPIKEEDQVN